MEYYSVLLPLAMILVLSKLLVVMCKKFGLPGVVGMLLAGILIGLIGYIPNQNILTNVSKEGLGFISKIGVILIMFSAGLETDIGQIRKTGLPSFFITLAGVILPLSLGFVVACLFNGGFADMTRAKLLSCLFYGVILTATSVSVTVATLKELGKLNGKVGSTVVTAAILDDIIGVIILSFVVALKGDEGGSTSPWWILLLTVLFFIAAIIVGTLSKKLFAWLEKKYPHHRRVAIFSLGLCFFFAYASEKWFGVADITGAFVAGLVLARNAESSYIESKADVISYMLFAPVFFANIGINTQFDSINAGVALFGLCFIIAGLIGKVIGCGGIALACKYSFKDSLRVGIGMMARAEVALVCAQKGVEHHLIDTAIMPFILILIVVSSFITPMILKASYKNDNMLEFQPEI